MCKYLWHSKEESSGSHLTERVNERERGLAQLAAISPEAVDFAIGKLSSTVEEY